VSTDRTGCPREIARSQSPYKKFTILDRDLTVESGEMTPNLKLKRKYVETQYADVLDAMCK
jgi:long-subunit acyl-CoA synthetase (AMP-forming)